MDNLPPGAVPQSRPPQPPSTACPLLFVHLRPFRDSEHARAPMCANLFVVKTARLCGSTPGSRLPWQPLGLDRGSCLGSEPHLARTPRQCRQRKVSVPKRNHRRVRRTRNFPPSCLHHTSTAALRPPHATRLSARPHPLCSSTM